MKSLFVILGNQLFDTKYIRDFKNSTFFMCEDYKLCTYQRHHKLKILLFLSSMRSYADLLKKEKYKIKYFDLDNDCEDIFNIDFYCRRGYMIKQFKDF